MYAQVLCIVLCCTLATAVSLKNLKFKFETKIIFVYNIYSYAVIQCTQK